MASKSTGKTYTIKEDDVKGWIEEGVKKLENIDCDEKKGFKKHSSHGTAGAVWFLGFIGSLVYFMQQADSFGTVIVGILKALVWPALLIYNLLDFLKI